ncbi:hypothetical protein H206_06968 [Candidatus Electrothrix aarhusensis]|uniref:Uncharacterized protein n=1 Tax=Candidatus Electrothrix aarhusensis TaxID=1859131 RepID=A0A3S3UB08_9BACT|nr:hypothetical protein H206_06968 [Candidatus Electrothrix aarhusensis]
MLTLSVIRLEGPCSNILPHLEQAIPLLAWPGGIKSAIAST